MQTMIAVIAYYNLLHIKNVNLITHQQVLGIVMEFLFYFIMFFQFKI